jgi:hypothetical protein
MQRCPPHLQRYSSLIAHPLGLTTQAIIWSALRAFPRHVETAVGKNLAQSRNEFSPGIGWITKDESAFPVESRLRLKMTSAKIENVLFLEACESLERKEKFNPSRS